jgi:hypothetical protein
LGLLPEAFSCYRSSALPLSHTTSRLETVTLLRLSRIINFMKSIVDSGLALPEPAPAADKILNSTDRRVAGMQLLKFLLYDGKIRGVSQQGEVYEHATSVELSQYFLDGLKKIKIKGAQVSSG